ncbi:MAG: hypothetical protein U5J63_01170 [Fodinibius sp.]|nr:hypothetical protein [Fodinibius sp.]
MIKKALQHIQKTAEVPSFSTYEERLHPYVRAVFDDIPDAEEIEVKGKNLVFRVGRHPDRPTIALAAHLDKINHYGAEYPDKLPVKRTDNYIEGAMDDCAGLGMLLTLAEKYEAADWPNLLCFFSEMEESKGLKEHAELLRNNGEGYEHGMGAQRIAERCVELNCCPKRLSRLIPLLFLRANRVLRCIPNTGSSMIWIRSTALIEHTDKTVAELIGIDPRIKLDNNTNDFLEYGESFNTQTEQPVVSVALEPAIYPYHQKGERVFVDDIDRCLNIVTQYLQQQKS